LCCAVTGERSKTSSIECGVNLADELGKQPLLTTGEMLVRRPGQKVDVRGVLLKNFREIEVRSAKVTTFWFRKVRDMFLASFFSLSFGVHLLPRPPHSSSMHCNSSCQNTEALSLLASSVPPSLPPSFFSNLSVYSFSDRKEASKSTAKECLIFRKPAIFLANF
jgi:hypothetical protein